MTVIHCHDPRHCPYCGRRTDYFDYVVGALAIPFLLALLNSCS
ncbi:hypothetical protein J3E64_002603 [Sphingobium sp. OAS761]|nr:hypothetical protein [Sphingobium sp. OAS761]